MSRSVPPSLWPGVESFGPDSAQENRPALRGPTG
jgi:hypothetical protein